MRKSLKSLRCLSLVRGLCVNGSLGGPTPSGGSPAISPERPPGEKRAVFAELVIPPNTSGPQISWPEKLLGLKYSGLLFRAYERERLRRFIMTDGW